MSKINKKLKELKTIEDFIVSDIKYFRAQKKNTILYFKLMQKKLSTDKSFSPLKEHYQELITEYNLDIRNLNEQLKLMTDLNDDI